MASCAVLITCFNRVDKTINCLKSIYDQSSLVDIYLLDDNSTDNTSLIINELYPNVKIFSGDGNFYWNRGMYFLWEKAIIKKYDFYLWVNNDVFLYKNALDELFDISNINFNKVLVSGLLIDPQNRHVSYGGCDENKHLVIPNGLVQPIKYLNGNLLLIPNQVVNSIGILDPVFHHDLGDVDYGFRAQKNGYKVLSTRIVVGECISNNPNRIRASNKNIISRFRALFSPLGSPFKQLFYFNRKHKGLFFAFFYLFYVIIINLIPDSIYKIFSNHD